MRRRFLKLLDCLLIGVILMSFIFPAKALAWSAANDWPGRYPTHQEILKAAYKILQSRDRPVLENSRFPGIDDINKYEGMGWNTGLTFDIIGKNQYSVLGPGPDDETRTAESAHYYNPRIDKGGGPDATKTYFSELCDNMYASSPSPEASSARGAAWSSHFISDMCVPYHVVGMPGADAKTIDAAGNYLLDDEKKTGPGFLSSHPTSPKEPPAGFGKDGNFSQNIRRYVIWSGEAGPKAKRDWFDPWYLNGGIYIFGWGWGDFQFLRSSHVEYEKYAHEQYMKTPYGGQDTNVPAWTNVLPTWDNLYGGQEHMAQDYARKAATITRDNLEKYWKDPAAAIYNAVELSYTLWRSSISALKPKLEVTPIGSAGSKAYRVKGTISNVAEEQASQVQARLSVGGGNIINNTNLQPSKPTDIGAGSALTVTWDISTDNIDKCKIKLEVIGQYNGTPDLGYAIDESSNANIDVSVSPSSIDAGQQVTISVKVQPKIDTPPEIKEWGPLEPASFTKQKDGSFAGKFTVKKDTKDGTYNVPVKISQLNLTGLANIYVGQNSIPSLHHIRAGFYVTPNFILSATGKSGFQDFSDPENNFEGTLEWIPGQNSCTATDMYNDKDWNGTITLDFDKNYNNITSFTWKHHWHTANQLVQSYVTSDVEVTGTNIPLTKRGSNSFVEFSVNGNDVCTGNHNLHINVTRTYRDGKTEICKDNFKCTAQRAGPYISFTLGMW